MTAWPFAFALLAGLIGPSPTQAVPDNAASSAKVMSVEEGYGPTKFICPVGGEAFEQDVSVSYYPLESLPNGSALGGQFSDRGVPVCPGNGLVLAPAFDEEEGSPEAFTPYTAEEIAQLPALIASTEYKALKDESRCWRLYWLAGKLRRPAIQRFHLLLHVSWLGDTTEAHHRNVGYMAAEGDALIEEFPPEFPRTLAKFYVANALRELGQFDEADVRLAQLLTQREAERARIEKSKPPANPHYETDEDRMGDGVIDLIIGLRKAIAERDDDMAPVSMMGERAANSICGNIDNALPPATDATRRGCAARKAERDRWDREFDEQQALENDPAKLAEMCTANPVDRWQGALGQACIAAQRKRERTVREAEAERLLQNPKSLDAQCKAVIIPSRYSTPKTALGKACQLRADDLRSAKQTEYIKKFDSDPRLYDQLCTMDYPDSISEDPLEAACAGERSDRQLAEWDRERKSVATLSDAEVAQRCKALEEGEQAEGIGKISNAPMVTGPDALRDKCRDLETARKDAERAAWEADPAKLSEACKTAAKVRYDGTVLELLCRDREQQRVDAAALELAVDHKKLVAACKSTPHPQRDAILAQGCNAYLKCVIAPGGIDTNEKGYNPFAGYGEDTSTDAGAKSVPYCFGTLEEADQFDANNLVFARTPAELEAERLARQRLLKEHDVVMRKVRIEKKSD
jgi:hypothetical protein